VPGPLEDGALRVAFRDVVRTISLALDMDEALKLNHGARVGLLAYNIGLAIGMEEPAPLYYAGLLHDLGAVGLENHIVHQIADGPKNEDVRMHAHRGARIVRPLSVLRPYESLIADHHERFDGEGFPAGKRGDDIPVGASIIHLSDLLDITLRRHVGGDTRVAALRVVRQQSGHGVPPAVASAAVDALLDDGLIAALTDDKALAAASEWLCPPTPGLESVTRVDLISQLLWVLARVVDQKHSYTMGHSTRVAHLAYRIAGAFSDSVNAWDVAWAGLLHDVGMIGVPTSVLNKRGPLDDAEQRVVASHASGSARIVSSIRDLAHLSLPAASHHERYDGAGYPRGLGGESIPLAGRMLAYADTYDALTSLRPHRAPLSHAEALTQIRSLVGSALDPHLANAAFAALLEWGPAQREGMRTSPFAQFFERDDADLAATFGPEAASSSFLRPSPAARLTTLEPWVYVSLDADLRVLTGMDSLREVTREVGGESLGEHLEAESVKALEGAARRLARGRCHTQYAFTRGGKPLEATLARSGTSLALLLRSAQGRQQSIEQFALFYGNFFSTTDAVMFVEPTGRIIDVNKRFVDLFGFDREEVIGQTTRILQSGRQDPDVYRGLWEAITHPSVGSWSGDIVDRKRTGEEVDVRLSIEAIRDASGVCIGYVGHLTDISERRRLEAERRLRQEELQRANEELLRVSRFKDDLIAVTSHDLRGPLGAIANVAGLLREGLTRMSQAEVAALLDRIRETATRTTELVNDLLDLEKTESGALELHPCKLRLGVLLAQCIERAQAATRKTIHFALEVGADECLVVGDVTRLEQVFLNLLGNAAKFTPERSTVTVRAVAHSERDRVVVQIDDRGPGIPEHALVAIFDRFYQVKSTSSMTTRGFGTGLGLNIVRNLVALHGGTVRAENLPGGGCRFCVDLPRRSEDLRLTRPTAIVLARFSPETEALLEMLNELEVNALWIDSSSRLRSVCALTGADLVLYEDSIAEPDSREFLCPSGGGGADQALPVLLVWGAAESFAEPGQRSLASPVLHAELREILREVALRRASRKGSA